MLINHNLTSAGIKGGEGIFLFTSPYPCNFTQAGELVSNTSVSNICDMIDARPVWDGSQWHVYVQAATGTYTTGSCGTANVYEAVGTSLSPGSLHWVTVPGNPSLAQAILSGTGSVGIGERVQWFNPSQSIPGWNFLTTFNNFGQACTAGIPNGYCIFSYISQNDSQYYYWYGGNAQGLGDVAPAQYTPPNLSYTATYPDVILASSLDAATLGDPGLGMDSSCYPANSQYQYMAGIGFFDNPTLSVPSAPNTNTGVLGPVLSTNLSNGGYPGPIGFRPTLARNEYGYLPPNNPGGYPRTWTTYYYFTGTQTHSSTSGNCSLYDNWNNTTNVLAVVQMNITEQ